MKRLRFFTFFLCPIQQAGFHPVKSARSKIYFTAVIISLYCGISGHAQNAPAIEWQKCLGGSDSDIASAIQQTIAGGFIIAGSTNSFDGDISGNHGEYDCWIVKLDAVGTTVWQKCLGGSGYDFAYSIQQTTDAGFIVAGSSTSDDGDVSGHHGISWPDYWVIKLDSAGNIEWQKCLGGSYIEEAYAIQQTFDGGFIVVGYTFSNDGDVSGNQGGADYWIVKLDSAGNIMWQECFGDASSQFAYSVCQTLDGGYIVGGKTLSSDGLGWILNLNGSGGLEWSAYAFDEDARVSAVAQTQEGGSIVAGSDRFSNSIYEKYDWQVMRFDSSGNVPWLKSLGGSDNDQAYSVWQTIDEEFIIAGYSASNDGDVSGNHGLQDYWIVNLDIGGNLIWQKSLGGSLSEEAYSMQQTADSGYIVAGFTDSNDGDVFGNHGGSDYWIVKLSCNSTQIFYADGDSDGFGNVNANVTASVCTPPSGYIADSTDCNDTNANVNPNATEILFNNIDDDCDGYLDEFGTGVTSIANDEFIFSLFPNPTNGEFVVYLQLFQDLNAEAKIEVINLLGQVVYDKTIGLQKGKLNEEIQLKEQFMSGLYMVYIKVNGAIFNHPLIVQL